MIGRTIAWSLAILATLAGVGQAAADCAGQASLPWTSAGKGQALSASAMGAARRRAAVRLAIIGPGGKVLHR